MKANKLLTTLITSTLLSTAAFAGGDIIVEPDMVIEPVETTLVLEPMYYVGIGGVAAGLSRDCSCKKSTQRIKDMTYGLILKAGINIPDYDYLGVEARYINSFIEDDFSQMQHFGLYLKPQYQLNEEAKVYGLLGYGKTTVDYTFGKRSSTLSESGFSYGAGAEYALENNLGLWIDMQHIFSNEGTFNTDLNLGTLGVMYNF